MDNKSLFDTVAFHWTAIRKNLIPEEKFLFDRYLNKLGRTVEAGTGGGRIPFELRALGFESLYGFDYVPRLIEAAKKKDTMSSIHFDVQDAVSLDYEDDFFDQIVYLQQIICTLVDEDSRFAALREAYRILKPQGTALFSFLSFEARRRSVLYLPYLIWLKGFRAVTRSTRPLQHLPWLKLGGRFNLHSLIDRGPYVYWYKLDEAVRDLESLGFRIVAVGSSRQLCAGRIFDSYAAMVGAPLDGMLYIVAKK